MKGRVVVRRRQQRVPEYAVLNGFILTEAKTCIRKCPDSGRLSSARGDYDRGCCEEQRVHAASPLMDGRHDRANHA
jgi:hypothetical protein